MQVAELLQDKEALQKQNQQYLDEKEALTKRVAALQSDHHTLRQRLIKSGIGSEWLKDNQDTSAAEEHTHTE